MGKKRKKFKEKKLKLLYCSRENATIKGNEMIIIVVVIGHILFHSLNFTIFSIITN